MHTYLHHHVRLSNHDTQGRKIQDIPIWNMQTPNSKVCGISEQKLRQLLVQHIWLSEALTKVVLAVGTTCVVLCCGSLTLVVPAVRRTRFMKASLNKIVCWRSNGFSEETYCSKISCQRDRVGTKQSDYVLHFQIYCIGLMMTQWRVETF
jgi:hypothetical protein